MNFYQPFLIIYLSDDCFFEIFHYIPNVFEKIRLKRVCRRFFQAVNNYFSCHSIVIERYNLFTPCKMLPLDQLLISCPKLTSLTISDCSLSNSIKKVNSMKDLVFLKIKISSVKAKKPHLETFFKKCPNLETLVLNTFDRKFFNFDCLGHRIKYLTIEEKFFKSLKEIFQKRGTQLIKIRIDNGGNIKISKLNDLISLISENCSSLEELEIEGWFSGSKFVLPKVKSLKRLRIYLYWQYITYDLFKDMFQSMPDLQSLEYDFEDSPSNDEMLELLNRFCVKIETLYNRKCDYGVYYINYVTRNGLEIWKNLKNLKAVDDRSFEEWLSYEEEDIIIDTDEDSEDEDTDQNTDEYTEEDTDEDTDENMNEIEYHY